MKSLHSQHGEVRIGRDLDELSRQAASLFCDLAQTAIGGRGRFALALSGGSTPRRLYELLGSTAFRGRVHWPEVYVFWGDERCVPPDSPESNYRLAHESLLSRVPIPEQNVHRMRGEDDPARAATRYEEVLRDFFQLHPGEVPSFDLILLGLGGEGHIASLFPNSPALAEKEHLVVAPYVEQLRARRLTFTLPVINQAAAILFLVSGAAKSSALCKILEYGVASDLIPATHVRPVAGQVYWFVDEPAASRWLPAARAS